MPIIQNLIADQFGTHLGKYSGRLKLTKGKQTLAQAPLIHLQSVTIASSGVSISADAIKACTENGIPIHFLSGTGNPYASLYSSGLTGTVLTRRAQLGAYNTAVALYIAAAIVEGKIENQARLLKYIAKYRKETDHTLYQELRWLADEVRDHLAELHTWLQVALRDDALIGDVRFELLSIEARAAQKYWCAYKELLPEELNWPGRQTRGARDPFNSALNYGYGILYSAIERALVLAGLDPFGGFLHADRPGKVSLVYDLVEPFRPAVVDRTVLGMVNKGMVIEQDERGFLTEKTRQQLAEKILSRLESNEKYAGKRYPLRVIIQMQARQLATYVRGERPEFVPFLVGW